MEQLVARRAHNPKVEGSSPSPATNSIIINIVTKEPVGSFFYALHFQNELKPCLCDLRARPIWLMLGDIARQ